MGLRVDNTPQHKQQPTILGRMSLELRPPRLPLELLLTSSGRGKRDVSLRPKLLKLGYFVEVELVILYRPSYVCLV